MTDPWAAPTSTPPEQPGQAATPAPAAGPQPGHAPYGYPMPGFYGPPPKNLSAITAPVYGFYAGNDARISATVPDTMAAMKAVGKKYEPVIYDGAGHGFMRAGEDPTRTTSNEANVKARDEAWERWKELLKGL